MSEYQFIHFLAVDRPLNDEELEFMGQQSSRADITRWDFTNEYHFGDFHGNAPEMLRRGYDLHLRYANFGIRRLMIRLPTGLPCDRATFDAYLPEYGVKWVADKKGTGGVLAIAPEADPGAYDEIVDDVSAVLPKIAPVRERLIGGDLRALYLAWLACPGHDETMEPPVPAGLGKLSPALRAMADFYEIGEDLIAAAAQRSPPPPKEADAGRAVQDWIAKQSRQTLHELVERLLGDDATAVRAAALSRIREEHGVAAWPAAEPTRTRAQLRELAGALGQQRLRKEEKAQAAARRKRLAAIAADPKKTIAAVEKLVKERSIQSYDKAAEELVDLREALGPEAGPARARAVAEKLRQENPRHKLLVSALRKHGLLD